MEQVRQIMALGVLQCEPFAHAQDCALIHRGLTKISRQIMRQHNRGKQSILNLLDRETPADTEGQGLKTADLSIRKQMSGLDRDEFLDSVSNPVKEVRAFAGFEGLGGALFEFQDLDLTLTEELNGTDAQIGATEIKGQKCTLLIALR